MTKFIAYHGNVDLMNEVKERVLEHHAAKRISPLGYKEPLVNIFDVVIPETVVFKREASGNYMPFDYKEVYEKYMATGVKPVITTTRQVSTKLTGFPEELVQLAGRLQVNPKTPLKQYRDYVLDFYNAPIAGADLSLITLRVLEYIASEAVTKHILDDENLYICNTILTELRSRISGKTPVVLDKTTLFGENDPTNEWMYPMMALVEFLNGPEHADPKYDWICTAWYVTDQFLFFYGQSRRMTNKWAKMLLQFMREAK